MLQLPRRSVGTSPVHHLVHFSGSLMVQIVVLQCIIWYTLMLFMFEYKGVRLLIFEQFPDATGTIVSIHVDSDVMSLDGRHYPLETDAQIKEDGKLHVTVRKSNASRSDIFSRRSQGFSSTNHHPSNLTNAKIYSLQSSRNPTPRGSSFNHTDFYSMMAVGRNSNFGANDVYGLSASGGPTLRPSNYNEDASNNNNGKQYFERQRLKGARERLMHRETQLQAFYSTIEEIQLLFSKQQEQLKSMQRTLEDDENYENTSVEMDGVIVGTSSREKEVHGYHGQNCAKARSTTFAQRLNVVHIERLSNEASVNYFCIKAQCSW
ncbi:hypothetical protein JHK86_042608 [Glycine max]|nr:hypothetical protein JHK86_042608 [Glycine max]